LRFLFDEILFFLSLVLTGLSHCRSSSRSNCCSNPVCFSMLFVEAVGLLLSRSLPLSVCLSVCLVPVSVFFVSACHFSIKFGSCQSDVVITRLQWIRLLTVRAADVRSVVDDHISDRCPIYSYRSDRLHEAVFFLTTTSPDCNSKKMSPDFN